MKRHLLYMFIKSRNLNPKALRKIKIFALMGLIVFFVAGFLTIWAGIAAFQFASSRVAEVIQSPATAAQVEALKSEARNLPGIQPLSCWNQAQSLLAVEPWLEKPLKDHITGLRTACLNERKEVESTTFEGGVL